MNYNDYAENRLRPSFDGRQIIDPYSGRFDVNSSTYLSSAQSRPARIGIIENNGFFVSPIKESLMFDERYEVVYSGRFPLDDETVLLAKHPDLILIKTPVEPHRQDLLLDYIKSLVKLDIAVIVLAAKINNEERARLFEAGISTYCSQEINADTLTELIDINIEGKRKTIYSQFSI